MGYPVREDYVIDAIRKVKSALGVAKNNTLVVCQGCADLRKQKREKFEQRFVQYGAVAVIAFLLLVLVPVFFGGGKNLVDMIKTAIMAAVLALVVILFALLSYSPAYEPGKTVGRDGVGGMATSKEPGEKPVHAQKKPAPKPTKAGKRRK
jgi:hypothetical protein